MAILEKIGTLYMNGVKVKFTGDTRTQYILNSPLEIRNKDTDSDYIMEFLRVSNGVKQYLISTNVLLTNISYDDLSRQALVSGQILTIDGQKYKVRLMSGGTSLRVEGDNYSKANPMDNEWDKYLLNEIGLSTLPTPNGQDLSGSYTDATIITSNTNNIWHWYKMSSLTSSKNGYDVTVRGNLSASYFSTINQFARSANVGWRMLMEIYNEPPVISGQDRYLNSYTSSFKQSYTISDGDADLMKVEEFIDNALIRTLENETTGFTSYVDLSSVWDSLSYDIHTITIKVTDAFGNQVSRNYTFKKIQILSGQTDTLTKPVIITKNNSGILNPINALAENWINFNIVGGDIVYFNEINIVDNSTGETVYNRKIELFDFYSTILRNSLVNGKEYQIKIRTYNDNNQYSAWSDVALIKTFSPAEIIINNIINNQITVQNPLFKASFSQSDTYVENGNTITKSDTLSTYQFYLVQDGKTITESDVLTDGLLSWQCSVSLENKTNYTIKLITLTNGNVETVTSEDFYALYEQTRMTALMEAKADPLNGAVILNVYAKQIRGFVENGDIQYINGEWCDTHSGVVIFNKESPFKLEGDFTMKIWARDLEDNNSMLMKLSNDIGYIELTKYDNIFFLSKWVSGVLLYQKYFPVSGDINPEDELFFFIQHEASTGLMNFSVTRVTDGTITWFKPKTDNDLPPSVTHTLHNAYDKEDGFLTNFSNGFRSLIIPVSVDGVNTNVYLPSLDNLVGNNAYSLFKNIQPTEDTNYSEERNILGEFVIGESLLGSETVNDITIRIKNNYTGSNPLNIKYKLFNYGSTSVSIYEKLDGTVFNTRKNITNPSILSSEFVLDLTSYWSNISYGEHSLEITLVDNTGYTYTKSMNFNKGADKIGLLTKSAIDTNNDISLSLVKGQHYKYFTRTVDSTDSDKLMIINNDGTVISGYPKSTDTGIRAIFNLPLGIRCTTYKDSIDNCYIVTTKLNNIFTTQTLGDLKVGDKIKECFTIYSNENLEFTIINKSDTMITVITDVITLKSYDVAESVLINGDIMWNQSNIKQWLNSNDKLVRRK